MDFFRLGLSLFLLAITPVVTAQSTADLQDFNAAYLQWGNTLESNPDIAREAAGRAYELGRKIFGEESERTAVLAINYANLLPEETQTQDYLDAAVTIYQSIFGFGSVAMIDPLMRLGRSLADTEKFHLATAYYQRALQLAVTHQGEESTKAGEIQLELGSIALIEGDIDDAFSRLQTAQQILQQFSDTGSLSNLARTKLLLGDYYLNSRQYQQALLPLLQALNILAAYPNADVTLRNRIALITAYENLGLQDQATEHCLAVGANWQVGNGEFLTPLYAVLPGAEQGVGTAGEEYAVRLSFTVDAEGYVRNPRLMSTVRSDVPVTIFLNAIGQFRFAPRFVDGKAVATADQQYVFSH